MSNQSNLPPSAEEEETLKASLRQKTEEMSAINEKISQAQGAIASATQALDILAQSSARSHSILRTRRSDCKTWSHSPPPCTSNHELSATALAAALTKECDAISLNSNIEAPLPEEETSSSRGNAFSEIKTLLASVDDALRRQRLIVNVNSSSIQLYLLEKQPIQAILDDIQERLSVIKRVPDEVWYEILTVRISQKSHFWPQTGDAALSVPALPYTHVCRSWRRVVNSSPSMWRAIHWNMDPDKEPNRNLIDLWISRSPENERRIYERQSYSGLAAAGLAQMKLELPIHEKTQYYLHQTRRQLPYGQSGDYSTVINLPSLFLQASKSSTRIPRLQATLIHRFPLLESLHLQDMLPRDIIKLPDTLTHLALSFAVPHERYNLTDLLRPSLESLKLSHFNSLDVPMLMQWIVLPNLRTLDITPLEQEIIAKLKLPLLEKLFICPPRNSAARFADRWVESLIPHCAKVENLRFDWPSSLSDDTALPLERLQVLFELRLHTPKLRTVKFSSGPVDGNALANFLGTDQHRRLEKLTIDSCTGVSRMDCERLVEYVDSLHVYRSVHGVAAQEKPE